VSSDLYELYQEMILDHNRSPRNFREMPDATAHAEGFNPLCGDHVHVYLKLEDHSIADISFQGKGCAISKASASMMTAELKGRTAEDAEQLFAKVHAMLTREIGTPPETEGLGKVAVLAGVSEFPARVKCASLAWHTMHSALSASGETVTTE
jgi:nitrogen fixation protein NifU and related proteins